MTVIFFDIDGTLLDHAGAERASATALHRALGAALPVEKFLSRWSAALEREFARYLKGEITYQAQGRARVRAVIDPALADDDADRIYAQYLAGYEEAWSLFPDVLPCLNMLAEHRLGVISNGLTSEQRRKLIKTGIDARFEAILISEECGRAKPSPEIFHHGCAAIGESPANVIYVGDHYDLDARAARRAGLTGIWLDRRGHATGSHLHPIITKLDQLPALLKSRRRSAFG